jgi:predicted O-methyltransferase YrrM
MIEDKPLRNFLFETDETGLYNNIQSWGTPWIDICCILHLIKWKKPKTFLEVGVCAGHTTRILAQKFPDMVITGIDPGDQVAPGDRPSIQINEYLQQDKIGELVNGYPNVTIIKEKFRDVNWTQKFDFIFIDANHSYNEVIQDSNLAFKLVNNNGIIIWHDYGNIPDVKKALEQLVTKKNIIYIHHTWIAFTEC